MKEPSIPPNKVLKDPSVLSTCLTLAVGVVVSAILYYVLNLVLPIQ